MAAEVGNSLQDVKVQVIEWDWQDGVSAVKVLHTYDRLHDPKASEPHTSTLQGKTVVNTPQEAFLRSVGIRTKPKGKDSIVVDVPEATQQLCSQTCIDVSESETGSSTDFEQELEKAHLESDSDQDQPLRRKRTVRASEVCKGNMGRNKQLLLSELKFTNSYVLSAKLNAKDGLGSCPTPGTWGAQRKRPKDSQGVLPAAKQKAARQSGKTEVIRGAVFTVMRDQGEEANLDLQCQLCHAHRRCRFHTDGEPDKDTQIS